MKKAILYLFEIDDNFFHVWFIWRKSLSQQVYIAEINIFLKL